MKQTLLVLFVLSSFLTSCAFTPQQVELNPEIDIASSNMGNGKKITITTVDGRMNDKIGNRGVGGVGSEITTQDNVAHTVMSALADGLQKHGFDIGSALDSDSRELRIEVRNLNHSVTRRVITRTLITDATLKGICVVNHRIKYYQLYHGGSVNEVIFAQMAVQNTARINEALSEVIQKLLDDQDLLGCLAG